MVPERRTAHRLVAVAVAAVLVGGSGTWLALRGADGTGASGGSALPSCADLLGAELGPVGEDPAWNGCLAGGGAAAPSYGYGCSGPSQAPFPRGEGQPVSDDAAVLFLPDAGLMAATGQPWVESPNVRAAYLRTPFALLVEYGCDELRSLPPRDGTVLAACDLDDVPLDLLTTQGCSQDGEHHAAVGRICSYPDHDVTTTWEQWSIDVPELPGGGPVVLESGPDEQWWAVPPAHRDDRCSTPPDQWDEAWR